MEGSSAENKIQKKKREIDPVKETTRIKKMKLDLSSKTNSDKEREKIDPIQIFSKKSIDLKQTKREIKRIKEDEKPKKNKSWLTKHVHTSYLPTLFQSFLSVA